MCQTQIAGHSRKHLTGTPQKYKGHKTQGSSGKLSQIGEGCEI